MQGLARMMAKLKDVLSAVGDTTATYASAVGCRTKDFAKAVGPKRGGIALGVLAVAIATPFVIRYIRARRAEANEFEEQELAPEGSVKRRRRRTARGTNTAPFTTNTAPFTTP
jgi:hypothetical protein